MFQGITYSKSSGLIKNKLDCGKKKIILNKTGVVNCKSERICLVDNAAKISESIYPEILESPLRRQTYSIEDKENLPDLKSNKFKQGNIFPISEHSLTQSDKNCKDRVYNNFFNIQNINNNCNMMTNDLLDESLPKMNINNSPFNDFCLTPLKGTENLLSPFSITKKFKSYDITGENTVASSFSTSPFEPIDASTAAKIFTPEERKPTRVSVNLCNKFEKTPKNKIIKASTTFIKDTTDSKTFISPPKQSFSIEQELEWTPTHLTFHHTSNTTN